MRGWDASRDEHAARSRDDASAIAPTSGRHASAADGAYPSWSDRPDDDFRVGDFRPGVPGETEPAGWTRPATQSPPTGWSGRAGGPATGWDGPATGRGGPATGWSDPPAGGGGSWSGRAAMPADPRSTGPD